MFCILEVWDLGAGGRGWVLGLLLHRDHHTCCQCMWGGEHVRGKEPSPFSSTHRIASSPHCCHSQARSGERVRAGPGAVATCGSALSPQQSLFPCEWISTQACFRLETTGQ